MEKQFVNAIKITEQKIHNFFIAEDVSRFYCNKMHTIVMSWDLFTEIQAPTNMYIKNYFACTFHGNM